MADESGNNNNEGLEVNISFDDGKRRSVTFGENAQPVFIDNDTNDDDEDAQFGSITPSSPSSSASHRRTLSNSLPSNGTRKASFVHRDAKWPRSLSMIVREDHMNKLIQQRRTSMASLFPSTDTADETTDKESSDDVESTFKLQRKESMEMHSEFVRHLKDFLGRLGYITSVNLPSMEIRLQNVSYRVPSLDDGSGKNKIPTIYNTSPLYSIQRFVKWLSRTAKKDENNNPSKKKEKLVTNVLTNVNLVLKPKCMYLILGPPLSGKTSLLKAIAGMLPQGTFPKGYTTTSGDDDDDNKFLTGQILYNNLVVSGDGVNEEQRTLFKNLVAFVRQNDAHAPRLTVAETFLFSGNCKDENIRMNDKGTSMDGKVGLTLEGLGLTHVQDTFVGNEQIRGVSGFYQKRYIIIVKLEHEQYERYN